MPQSAETSAARALLEVLCEAQATVGFVESLTAGEITARLADVPGASRALVGGLVTYSNDAKRSLAQVPEQTMAKFGAVSAPTALAMAIGGRRALGSDYALSCTGVAGPDPVEGKAVGTVFVAIAGPARNDVQELALRGDRWAIRQQTTTESLRWLTEVVRGSALGAGGACEPGEGPEVRNVDPPREENEPE